MGRGDREEEVEGGAEEKRFYPSLVSYIVCVHNFLSLSLILELVLLHAVQSVKTCR